MSKEAVSLEAMPLADPSHRARIAELPRAAAEPDDAPSRLMPKAMQAKVRVAGMGVFLPPHRRTSADIDQATGRPPGTTERNTSVVERPLVTTETSSGMAVEAARRAIEASGLVPTDIEPDPFSLRGAGAAYPGDGAAHPAWARAVAVRHSGVRHQCELPELRCGLRPCGAIDRGRPPPQRAHRVERDRLARAALDHAPGHGRAVRRRRGRRGDCPLRRSARMPRGVSHGDLERRLSRLRAAVGRHAI